MILYILYKLYGHWPDSGDIVIGVFSSRELAQKEADFILEYYQKIRLEPDPFENSTWVTDDDFKLGIAWQTLQDQAYEFRECVIKEHVLDKAENHLV